MVLGVQVLLLTLCVRPWSYQGEWLRLLVAGIVLLVWSVAISGSVTHGPIWTLPLTTGNFLICGVLFWCVASDLGWTDLKAKTPGTIRLSADELQLEVRGEVTRIPWVEVSRIDAFKRDRLVHDEICLTITEMNGKRWECNEDFEGWDDLLNRLPEFLPGVTPSSSWMPRVIHPPFETSGEAIFFRSSG